MQRLLLRIKKEHLQLRLVLAVDNLYACGAVFALAKELRWSYVVTPCTSRSSCTEPRDVGEIKQTKTPYPSISVWPAMLGQPGSRQFSNRGLPPIPKWEKTVSKGFPLSGKAIRRQFLYFFRPFTMGRAVAATVHGSRVTRLQKENRPNGGPSCNRL
jgi:hypothetical protein